MGSTVSLQSGGESQSSPSNIDESLTPEQCQKVLTEAEQKRIKKEEKQESEGSGLFGLISGFFSYSYWQQTEDEKKAQQVKDCEELVAKTLPSAAPAAGGRRKTQKNKLKRRSIRKSN